MARVFVGIAWPYANGPFHIGHLAGAYLPGETFARFHRLLGDDVLMVSGSDMHGAAITIRADREGVEPREVAERYDALHRETFQRLGFSFDLYTHTHTVLHERTVQELFLGLLENGLLSRRTEGAAYCPKESRFLPDRYLTGTCPHCGNPEARGDECDHCGRVLEPKALGSPRCRICGTPAEFRPSEHFFLRLDLLEPKVRAYLAEHPEWRANVRGVSENFLAQGLHPTPITRDLAWGIPIPLEGYEGKRIYVWFEAVIGYLSASREWAVRSGDPSAWRRFWDPNAPVRAYYFIGKDNIFHHALLWPAISLGVGGLALASDVPANEWLTASGGKISKSGGSDESLFLPQLLDRYAPDVIRFYAAALAPQNHDTAFDPREFDSLATEVLSNQYGNLVQRLLVLTRDRYAGATPRPYPADLTTGPFAERVRTAHARIRAEYEQVHLKEALELALAEIREGNRWFHEAKPWQAPEPDRTRIVAETLWLLRAASIWLSPVLPFSSAEVYRMLGLGPGPSNGAWDEALVPPPAGTQLGEIRPLFPRADRAPVAPEITSAEIASAPLGEVPLEIRAGVIRTAAPHPKADRLYALTVDVGDPAPRSIVAGIRADYSVEQLVGRRVLVLANLEPRTIRSVASLGMMLAADVDGHAALLAPPEDVAPGAVVSGATAGARTITYAEFERRPIGVGVVAPGDPATAELAGRRVAVDGPWAVGEKVAIVLDGVDAPHGLVLAFGPGRPAQVPEAVRPGAKVR